MLYLLQLGVAVFCPVNTRTTVCFATQWVILATVSDRKRSKNAATPRVRKRTLGRSAVLKELASKV